MMYTIKLKLGYLCQWVVERKTMKSTKDEELGLGIDTGSTFTDAVLVDLKKDRIIKTAKTPTTHDQLLEGILTALDQIFKRIDPVNISLAVASTTIATNAIVENKGRQVGLILLGWEPEENLELPPCQSRKVRGRFNPRGEEKDPLDLRELISTINRFKPQVEAFAVSGYFSVRNPQHELKAKEVIQKKTGLPVVCGHELTTKLGIYERTVTAVLNARIAPFVSSFLNDLKEALNTREITCSLMIMQSDGSLTPLNRALKYPVRTVLSGPAASAIGSLWLSKEKDLITTDIGGTTTDIISLKGGLPTLKPEGATVGGWRTRVPAVDAWTVGLGGDSRVHIEEDIGKVKVNIGPRRSIPLAFSNLESNLQKAMEKYEEVQFFRALDHESCLNDQDPALTSLLELIFQKEAINKGQIREWARQNGIYLISKKIEKLEDLGLIQRIGFTPTDALHVLGQYREGDVKLAQIGADVLGSKMNLSPLKFSQLIKERLERLIKLEIIKKIMVNEKPQVEFEGNPLWEYLIQENQPTLKITPRLPVPIVGVGAPASCFLPSVAKALHSELILTDHHQVGNAVGAISGSVVGRVKVHLRQQSEHQFLIFFPGRREEAEFEDPEQAMEHGLSEAKKLARKQVESQGAKKVNLLVQEKRFKFRLGRIQVVAVGKPAVFN